MLVFIRREVWCYSSFLDIPIILNFRGNTGIVKAVMKKLASF